MKRIVAIAAGVLAMLLIIAYSIYSINHIEKINQKRRDSEEGRALASAIAETTATTSIWEYLRSTTAAPVEDASEAVASGEEASEVIPEGEELETETADNAENEPETESLMPEIQTEAPVQTTTTAVSTGIVINIG
jgi:hypothetical protein